jgi:hypothetical protein
MPVFWTERHGQVVNTPASYSGGSGFKSPPGDQLSWLRFSWFSSVPLGKCRDKTLNCKPGSSVSIVSGFGLEDRAIEVRSPEEMKGSWTALGHTHPSVQLVPGVLSPGLKRGRGVTLTTHPHLVQRSRMSRSYTSSPPSAFVACVGTALALVP